MFILLLFHFYFLFHNFHSALIPQQPILHINTLTLTFSLLVISYRILILVFFSSTLSLGILNFFSSSPKKGLLCHDTKLLLRMQITHDLSVVLSSLPPNLYLFIDTGPICFPFGTSVPSLSPRSSIGDSVY